MEPKKVYITLREFSKIQKGFTYFSLRRLHRFREINGFSPAFLKLGKKILLEINEFYACIERINDEKKRKK